MAPPAPQSYPQAIDRNDNKDDNQNNNTDNDNNNSNANAKPPAIPPGSQNGTVVQGDPRTWLAIYASLIFLILLCFALAVYFLLRVKPVESGQKLYGQVNQTVATSGVRDGTARVEDEVNVEL